MNTPPLDQQLESLERRVTALATNCEQLKSENVSLRAQQQELIDERARLIEKNETARRKVEQMILRLKSLEAGQ